jgi:hypothetical protein
MRRALASEIKARLSLEYKYDAQRRLLRATASGTLRREDFDQLDASTLLPGTAEVLDLRGMSEIGLSPDEIRALARREVGKPHRVARLAIVAGSTAAFGLARMFGILAEGASYQTSVFSDLDAALAWLGVEGDD